MTVGVIHRVEYMAEKLCHTLEFVFHNKKMNLLEDYLNINDERPEGNTTIAQPVLMNDNKVDNDQQVLSNIGNRSHL